MLSFLLPICSEIIFYKKKFPNEQLFFCGIAWNFEIETVISMLQSIAEPLLKLVKEKMAAVPGISSDTIRQTKPPSVSQF